MKNLEEFRVQASETYGSLAHTRGPLKRTKESSTVVEVSPDIAKAGVTADSVWPQIGSGSDTIC